MHASGHVGVALAAGAPLTVGLGAAGLDAAVLPTTAVLVGLATLPDVDHSIPGMGHRTATHSLPFALATGIVVAGVAWVAGPALVSGEAVVLAALGFAVGTLAVVLHVLADVVTPMGVYPLWPISRQRRSLALVRSANPLANRALLLAGAALWITAAAGPTLG